MRVLIIWGSKRGGTEGIGRILAARLEARGLDVVATPAHRAPKPRGFDAAVIGGALYANRWHPSVRRFVRRHVKSLRQIPVWLFSSGPLDDSAERTMIPPTDQVSVIAEQIGAKGHVTFGGRLATDVRGFPARALAKEYAGDWRNPELIRSWADQLAAELPHARPNEPTPLPARSWARSLGYAVSGWALCGAMTGLLLWIATPAVAIVVHAIAAPIIFAPLAWRYFGAHGSRDPLPTAATWTATVLLLDGVLIAGLLQKSLAMFESVVGTWLPLALIFLVVWAVGGLMSTQPWQEPSKATA